MADHWVSKLFPPKFEFETVGELLQPENSKPTDNSYGEYITKDSKYRRIYKEMFMQREAKETEGETQITQDQTPTTDAEKLKKEVIISKKSNEHCLWTNEEMRVLRKTFQKSKVQNVHLTGMVNSLRQELQTCKEREQICQNSYSILSEKWSELKKRYKRAKISCKSLKEDLKLYHSSLKSAREENALLNSEKKEILQDLDKTKMLLESQSIDNSHLKMKLKDMNSEKALAIEHCEFVAKQQREFEVHTLKMEIYHLKEELAKERKQNVINTKSIENLRNHFVSLKINSDLLNVADTLSPAEVEY